MGIDHLRQSLARELDPALRAEPGLSKTNAVIVALILISLVVAILATEPMVTTGIERWFDVIEVIFVVLFSVEYLVRVWVCIENPMNANRWRYMARPSTVIDMATIVLIVFTFFGSSGFLLRLFRIVRVLRIARLGGFSSALELMGEAISRRRFELLITAAAAMLLLFFSSALLYLVEGGGQPENFGSIPRAMWWSVSTLTTVGYGDTYPVTPLGKVFAAFTAVGGIGLIAMPTGILAGAVSDAIQRSRQIEEKSKG